MEYAELEKEDLIKQLQKLKEENNKLKNRYKNKREKINTTKKEIVNYWVRRQDECELSVDWAEGEENCWRCGCDKNIDGSKVILHRCHIIPAPLGGMDTPSNFVLLCSTCHAEAPNINDKDFMWDWIKAYSTPFYNTYWNLRTQQEYEYIYKKSYNDELEEREILSYRDRNRLLRIPKKESITHFGQPTLNVSTRVGILRTRLLMYDEMYGNKNRKSKYIQDKEKKFESFVDDLCYLGKDYNWGVWEGGTKNNFSVTIYNNIYLNKKENCTISIRLGKDNIYRMCYPKEINPNNTNKDKYIIELGPNEKEIIDKIKAEIKQYNIKYGKPKEIAHFFTYKYNLI